MVDNLSDRLRAAQNLIPEWGDKHNLKWKEAEEILASFSLPDPVWVSFDHSHDEDHSHNESEPGLFGVVYERDIEWKLGYASNNGKWRLCYSEGEVGDQNSETKPILECSLLDRARAMTALPQLMEKMVEQAERIASEVESAVGLAAETLTGFKKRSQRAGKGRSET